MKLSKRKIVKLKTLSVSHEILKDYGYDWVDIPPEHWGKHEKELYDMVNAIEYGMINAFLEILGVTKAIKTSKQPKREEGNIPCDNCGRFLYKTPDNYRGRSPKCHHCGYQDPRK